MESFSSSVSTMPSFDDVFSHNMWNPLLELLFLEQVSGIFASCDVEIDLAKIALSCHFALDSLFHKDGAYVFAWCFIGPMDFVLLLWDHCHLRGIVIFFVVNTFATQFCSSLGTAVTRLYVLVQTTQV